MGNMIVIGTSHGYVLVFDSMQALKWCLGESHFREEGGSISSLAVSGNGTRLLVGYAKGLILMYDLENGKLLRFVSCLL
jgi:WD40 repeat protein